MFDEMTNAIQEDTTNALFHVRVETKVEKEETPEITERTSDESTKKGPYRRKNAKIGRNDPCPCGSGKKYKHCCDAVNDKELRLW